MSKQQDSISPEGALEHGVLDEAKGNKLVMALLIAAISASALSLVFSIGTAVLSASQSDRAEPSGTRTQQTTPERTLGTVGHPSHDAQRGDFEVVAHTMGALNPASFG